MSIIKLLQKNLSDLHLVVSYYIKVYTSFIISQCPAFAAELVAKKSINKQRGLLKRGMFL